MVNLIAQVHNARKTLIAAHRRPLLSARAKRHSLVQYAQSINSRTRMPNIGTVLKDEISRLSRRASHSQIDPTRKATAQHRRDIALLKRQVAQLERQVMLLTSKVLGTPPVVSSRFES